MSKTSFTHYYVQALENEDLPQIVYHTFDKKKNEYYHKFLDRKKANDLAKKEKEASPKTKFRVVKCIETYDASDWF